MTRPGIEPRSPGPLANTLTAGPMSYAVKKAITQQSGLWTSGWASEERERHNTDGHKFGGQNIAVMFGLQLSLTRRPWVTLFEPLQIKREVNILLKKSSSVCRYHCVSMYPAWTCRWQYNKPSYLNQRFRSLIRLSKELCCSNIISLCVLAHWSLLTLFCFLNSSFLTAILPYRPASKWILTFFTTLAQLCSDVWSSRPSVKQAGDWWNWLLFLSLLVYQPYFWSCFVPFPDISYPLKLLLFLFSLLKKKTPSNQLFKRYLVILRSKLLRKTFI